MVAIRKFVQLHRANLLIFGGLAFLLGWGWWRWQAAMSPAPAQQIVYLREDEAGVVQLWRSDVTDQTATPLTQEPADLTEFVVSPDGALLAYRAGDRIVVINDDGRSPRDLLACADFLCLNLAWSPDNQRLIYERRLLLPAGRLPAAPRIWWLDVISGETYPVLEEDHALSASATLSPDGQWISFFAPETESIELYNFSDGRHFQVQNQVGTAVVWHPTRPIFLMSDFGMVDWPVAADAHLAETHRHTSLGVHLFVVDAETQAYTQLSVTEIVDDATPAWSPDGEWIVFGRRPARTDLGRQLWLMRADGRDARPLTDEPLVHHGPPTWSADGRFLLFQRYDTAAPQPEPGIWLLQLDNGELTEVAANGFLPAWLP